MNCLVCVTKSEDLLEIFSEDGVSLAMAPILRKHLKFIEGKLSTPNLKSFICLECWHNVYSFNVFFTRVSTIHEDLLVIRLPDLMEIQESSVSTRTTRSQSKAEHVKQDIDENQTIEILEEENLDFTMEEDFLPVESKDYLEDILDPEESDFTPNSTDDETYEFTVPKKQNTKLRKAKSKKFTETNEIDNEEKETKRQSRSSQEEDNLIKEYCKMICDLCPYEFKDYRDVKLHFRDNHPGVKGYLTCCGKKFERKFYIVDHIISHKDPSHFQCQTCKKNYKDRIALKIHMSLHGALQFKCPHDGCDKSFPKKHKLTNHIKTSHIPEEDLIYNCKFCERRFNTLARLNYHHKQMHVEENRAFICDLCGKTLKSKSNLEFHRRIHEETEENIQRIQCTICSHWLKDKHSFRKHMKRHEQEKEDNSCTYCGKKSANKDALKSHIKYVHLLERKHQCNLCSKAFKTALSLKEHMASHGTGQSLYECSICGKTFNSNANMHAHRKKSHPKEWQESLMPKYLKP